MFDNQYQTVFRTIYCSTYHDLELLNRFKEEEHVESRISKKCFEVSFSDLKKLFLSLTRIEVSTFKLQIFTICKLKKYFFVSILFCYF